jgi:hypothetical protein
MQYRPQQLQALPMLRQAFRLTQGTRSLKRSNHTCAQRVVLARMQKLEVSVVHSISKPPVTPIHYLSAVRMASGPNSASQSRRVCTILSVRTHTDSPSRITKKHLQQA